MEPVLETKEVPSDRIRTVGSHTGPNGEMGEQNLHNKPVAGEFAVEAVEDAEDAEDAEVAVAEVAAAEVAAAEVEIEVEVVEVEVVAVE